jgi:hypothetical protein
MDIEYPENELNAMERRLAAWRPASGGLDRDRMLYEAGRAAARADDRVQSWRLAAAALTLLTVGLGGLLAHEQSQRQALETSIAMAARINPAQPAGEIALPAPKEIPAIEPSSYIALTLRLSQGTPDMSSLDRQLEPKPHRVATDRLQVLPERQPLQARDLQRVLDL